MPGRGPPAFGSGMEGLIAGSGNGMMVHGKSSGRICVGGGTAVKKNSKLKLAAFIILFVVSFLFGIFLDSARKNARGAVPAPASAAAAAGQAAENGSAGAQGKTEG